MKLKHLLGLSALLSMAACAVTPVPVNPAAPQEAQKPDPQELEAQELASLPPITPNGVKLDHSGRKQIGRASYYADYFASRKTADGTRLNPNADTAASKTLPLG